VNRPYQFPGEKYVREGIHAIFMFAGPPAGGGMFTQAPGIKP
jgi:hypothetical protein